MKRALVLLMAVLCFSGVSNAKKLWIWNTDKGDGPNDYNGCNISMSEQNAPKKGGISLKMECDGKGEGGSWYIGEMPAKKNWEGYDFLRFSCFNPGKTPAKIGLVMKANPNEYGKRIDGVFVARPGMNELEFEIAGACANDGTPYDFKKKVPQWNFCGDAKILYFSNVRLETADEEEKADAKQP